MENASRVGDERRSSIGAFFQVEIASGRRIKFPAAVNPICSSGVNESRTQSEITRARRWRFYLGLLLVAAAALTYGSSLRVPLIFDDHPAIERNSTIRQLWPLTPVLLTPVSAAGATGRPLVNLSLALNYAWSGLDVTGYHVFNLTVHLLAGLALWGLLRRTLRRCGLESVANRRAEEIAAAAALLWLVHPLQTESVICIVQRNELLAGLFLLLTLYAFERSTDSTCAGVWRGAAVASCVAGVLSKELVATAPLLVFLYDRTFVAGSFSAAWRARWKLYAALALTWIPLAALMVGTKARAGTVGFGLGMSGWTYLLTQCQALGIYLQLSIWPHPLVLDYGTEAVRNVGEVWLQGVLILSLLAATVWALWRRPVFGFLGAWFFVILAPSSSFVPLTTQPIAEHRMYLPLASVVILAVIGGARLTRRARGLVFGLGVGALALALSQGTFSRTQDYRTEESIWMDTVAKEPSNARGYASMGQVRVREKRWAEAADFYAVAVRLRPDYADAHNDYANVLDQLERRAEGLEHHAIAARLKPEDGDIDFNWAQALSAAGRGEEARVRFERVVRREPDRVEGWFGLSEAFLRVGRSVDAAEALLQAVRLRPAVPELYYNLGNIWLSLQRGPEAVRALSEAVRLRPEWAAAQNNLALALVGTGRLADAVPHYEAALQLLPGVAQVHHNLALALGKLGRVPEAIDQDEAGLRLQPDNREARAHLAWLRRR
jgi:protein O-mannosyl-transferase